MAVSDDEAAQALTTLTRGEVPGVRDARAAPDGTIDVVFTEAPSAKVVARARELLAPAEITVVWHTGEISTDPADMVGLPDDEGSDHRQSDRGDTAVPCGVCQAWPAQWQHSATTPPGAALASAAAWHLCDVCHELVLAENTEALAARVAIPDLDRTQMLDLVGRIH